MKYPNGIPGCLLSNLTPVFQPAQNFSCFFENWFEL